MLIAVSSAQKNTKAPFHIRQNQFEDAISPRALPPDPPKYRNNDESPAISIDSVSYAFILGPRKRKGGNNDESRGGIE